MPPVVRPSKLSVNVSVAVMSDRALTVMVCTSYVRFLAPDLPCGHFRHADFGLVAAARGR